MSTFSTPPPKGPTGKQRSSRAVAASFTPDRTSSPSTPTNAYQRDQNERIKYPSYQDANFGRPSSATYQKQSQGHGIPGTPMARPYVDGAAASDGQINSNRDSAAKKKARHKNRSKDATNVSQGPNSDSTRAPTTRSTSSNQIPNSGSRRSITTPMKAAAYAGPTFHASPAPSALPMPSFFSKSVPEVSSKSALQARLEEESSDNSEKSPVEQPSQLDNGIRELDESPLDLFFRADRQEKARAKDRSTSNTPNRDSNLSPFDVQRPHHSRHATSNSANELFPIEMDGTRTPARRIDPPFATPYNERMGALRTTSAPQGAVTQTENDEVQRRAKSEALKRLLMMQQRPSDQPNGDVPHIQARPSVPNATSPSGRDYSPSRIVSGPETPVPTSKFQNHVTPNPRNGSSTFFQQSPSTVANGSPRPNPRSSNLRQEIASARSSNRVELPGFPSSPTPRSNVSNPLTAPQENKNRFMINSSSPPPRFDPQNSHSTPGFYGSPSSVAKRNTTDVKTMEDNLRRMLKLDGLGAPGSGSGSVLF
ncbi:MAG: hypothetical protein M1819_004294 [Sarea resinae]|nr:MAG: hypothetical protein M1819_004294 [Sarea resinae]